MSKYSPSDQILQQIRNGNYEEFKQELIDHECTYLDLNNRNLGNISEAFFSHLGRALRKTKVKTLNFGHNNLGKKAAVLVKALVNTSVTKLNLEHNNIGAPDITRIKQAPEERLKFVPNPFFYMRPGEAPFIPAGYEYIDRPDIVEDRTYSNVEAFKQALQGSSIWSIYIPGNQIGDAQTRLIHEATLANCRRDLITNALNLGFQLGDMVRNSKTIANPNSDILGFIADRVPHLSKHPIAKKRFIDGYEASVSPNPEIDAIALIPKELRIDVSPKRTKSTTDLKPKKPFDAVSSKNARKGKNAKNPGVASIPKKAKDSSVLKTKETANEMASSNSSLLNKTWGKICNFFQSPSSHPISLGILGGCLLIGISKLCLGFTTLSACHAGFGIMGAINIGTYIRNYFIHQAVADLKRSQKSGYFLSSEKLDAYKHGCEASKSWTLYFGSFLSRKDLMHPFYFDAGMQENSQRILPSI